MTTARNAPCPCGSEKKFKACCGATGAPLPPVLDEEGEPVPVQWKLPALLCAVAVGLGVGVGFLRGGFSDGLAVSGAALLLVIGYLVIRAPPTSTGRGGGANIDYGMRKSRRSQGPRSRSQRRRGN